MEVINHTAEEIEIQDQPKILRLVLLASMAAGLLLPAANIKEYGIQSWYRATYWFGILMFFVGSGLLYYWNVKYNIHLDKASQKGSISRTKGFQTNLIQSFELTEIKDVRIEKKQSHPWIGAPRELYRLALQFSDETWIPVSPRFIADRHACEQTGQKIRAFITQ